jgi:hypothetical protein
VTDPIAATRQIPAVPRGAAAPKGRSQRHRPAAPSASGELAGWLAGEWTIARVINQGAGRFDGRARFLPDPESPAALVWHEHGRLRLGAHDGPAERTLRIEPAAPGGWEVRFADGRPFHRLDLAGGSCAATHLCGADIYSGRYEIQSAVRFTVTWRVAGPHKDDLIESVYERAA